MVINWAKVLRQADSKLAECTEEYDFEQFFTDFEIDILTQNKEIKLRIITYSFILADLKDIVKVRKLAKYLNDLYNIKLIYPLGYSFAFEVPRMNGDKIFLTNILDSSKEFIARFGIGIDNEIATINLEKQPHTLIAGATGSGKSVCLNTFICSLLMYNSPDYLKFIFVDSKRTELSKYKDIAHCEAFIDNGRDTVAMLKSVYQLIKQRNEAEEKEKLIDFDCFLGSRYVIVVDELADLISDPKYHDIIEYYLIKISQIGRSAGVHLVLATQHPIVKVINGSIKANMTTRLCLQTTSARDSMAILGHKGGEQLLGKGDCLYKTPFCVKEKRVQIACTLPENIDKIISVWKR